MEWPPLLQHLNLQFNPRIHQFCNCFMRFRLWDHEFQLLLSPSTQLSSTLSSSSRLSSLNVMRFGSGGKSRQSKGGQVLTVLCFILACRCSESCELQQRWQLLCGQRYLTTISSLHLLFPFLDGAYWPCSTRLNDSKSYSIIRCYYLAQSSCFSRQAEVDWRTVNYFYRKKVEGASMTGMNLEEIRYEVRGYSRLTGYLLVLLVNSFSAVFIEFVTYLKNNKRVQSFKFLPLSLSYQQIKMNPQNKNHPNCFINFSSRYFSLGFLLREASSPKSYESDTYLLMRGSCSYSC